MSSAFGIALTALRAFDTKLDVSANNIANANTDGFKKSRASLQEVSTGGVQVTIEQVNTPGIPLDVDEQSGRPTETSNVDFAEEFVDQMVTRYAFEASVVTVKNADEMQQTLLDILT